MKRALLAVVVVVGMTATGDAAWQYLNSNSVDGVTKAAYTDSITPFSGTGLLREQNMLMVRNHVLDGYGVIFGMEFHTYAGSNVIRVRFGNNAPEVFNVVYLRNFRDMAIVPEQTQDFINKVKRNQRVVVEQNIFNFGLFNFEYVLTGLNLNKLK
jgi:hypothetical protein